MKQQKSGRKNMPPNTEDTNHKQDVKAGWSVSNRKQNLLSYILLSRKHNIM